ncbi:MAG: peptidase C39 family protein [archaeon]
MKLNVPFYKQTTDLNCGPTALKMALSYLGQDFDINVIEEKTDIKEVKFVSTIQIAIASAELGFKTEFFSENVLFDERHKELDFYRKYSNMDLASSKKLLEKAKKLGINVDERVLSCEELISFISEDSIPIVLLDWNVVTGNKDKGYLGHFVPVVGCDDKNFYVHNQGFNNPSPFYPIEKRVFDEARKARGTDEDIVIVYRKK